MSKNTSVKILTTALILLSPLKVYAQSEDKCLATMVYMEARGQSDKGKKDVVDVMFNRLRHQAFPKTICGNINKKGQYPWASKKNSIKDTDE